MALRRKSMFMTLLLISLLTGTLDAIAAILISYKIPPAFIFKFIASGWFGPDAFKGGTGMVLWGLLFHYLIAAILSIICFLLYPAMAGRISNKYITGIIYGLAIWVIMNFGVLPFTNIHKGPAHIDAIGLIKGIAALMICVGIPVAVIADNYYNISKLATQNSRLKFTVPAPAYTLFYRQISSGTQPNILWHPAKNRQRCAKALFG